MRVQLWCMSSAPMRLRETAQARTTRGRTRESHEDDEDDDDDDTAI
jgi:hypothetical protein